MRILHITPSYKPAFVYGGPIYSVSTLCEAQVLAGNDVTVFTTNANGLKNLNISLGTTHSIEGVSVIYHKRITGDHTHISFALWCKLFYTANNYDVIHLHSWWNILIIGCAFILKAKRKRFILSPRGMFSPYSLSHNNNPLKGNFWMNILVKPLLKYQVFHCTAKSEQKEIEGIFGKETKIFTLPNLLKFPDLPSIIPRKLSDIDNYKCVKLLFISRIDRKKGIELLLDAIPMIKSVGLDVELTIIGAGDVEYIAELKSRVGALGIEKIIYWKGNVEWEAKFSDILNCDILVLPSYNENFANIILETLYAGKPVIVSKYVGLFDYVENNGFGWIIDTNAEDIKDAVIDFFRNNAIYYNLSISMREKIKNDFDGRKLANKYIDQYLGFFPNKN